MSKVTVGFETFGFLYNRLGFGEDYLFLKDQWCLLIQSLRLIHRRTGNTYYRKEKESEGKGSGGLFDRSYLTRGSYQSFVFFSRKVCLNKYRDHSMVNVL